ncbi:hypothetical protein M434DRAFT_401782 [Hypoxylon sp. CO27-5]|nr:hypothetical protein M434DRAFT_401782 [Hypoxylon sp. CO27-5]
MTNATNYSVIPVEVMNAQQNVSESSFLIFSTISAVINTAILATQLWSILKHKAKLSANQREAIGL